MRGFELYSRAIDRFDATAITQLFAVGVVVIVVAALLLSLGRLRPVAYTLGILGVLSMMLGLLIVHDQQVIEHQNQFVTVRRWRYRESARFQARVALLGLPAAAVFVMLQVLWTTQRRRRRTLPGHMKEGRISLARGDYDAALAAFNQALMIAPYLGDAYFQRGCAHESKGECDAALADFDHALKCDPQLAGAYLHRGRLRAERGEVDAAAVDLDHFMSMRPNDVVGYLNRGICLAKKGDVDNAISDFHRVLKLTNHSDYADPARAFLDRLRSGKSIEPDPGQQAAIGVNGAPYAALEAAPRPEPEAEAG